MALQATFVGNWQQFDQTMENAKKNIVAFEIPVKGLQRSLQQMVSSIDGSRMAREAATAAAAIEKVGGVTKLTDAEQRRWNASLQEFVEKSRAMGASVPADVAKVADEIRKAVKASDELVEANKKAADELKKKNQEAASSMLDVGNLAKSVGGIIAGAFTVQALVGFGKELVDLGGQITDLSERTGISTDVIQELKYAADQTGTTIENVTSSIEKMGINLSRGEKGTVAAVKDLGLSLESLRAMRPEEAFSTIADEIAKIPDPMRQADLATQLLGKSAAEALPAMKAGIRELREEAHELGQVLSKEAVASLDEFGDKWTKVMGGLKVAAAEAVLDIGKAFSDLPNILDTALAAGRLGLGPGGIGAAAALVGSGDRIRDSRQRTSDIALPPEVARSAADYADQLKKVREELAALPEATKRQIIAAKELKTVNEEDIAKGLKISVEAVKLYLEGLKEMESQQRKLASLSLTANFQETIAKAKQWVKEIDTGRISVADLGIKQQEVNKQLREAEQAMKAVGATGDPLYRRIVDLATATTDWSEVLPKVKSGVDDILKIAGQAAATKVPSDTLLGIMFGDVGKLGSLKLGDAPIGLKVDNADKQFEEFLAKSKTGSADLGKAIDGVARSLSQLSQIKPLDGALADFAELINLMNVGTQLMGGLANSFRTPMRDAKGNIVRENGQIQYRPGFSLDNFTGENGAEAAVAAYTAVASVALAASTGSTPVLQATNTMGRGNRALRGAAAGLAEGGQFGPWGAAGGAIFGAIIGAARNPMFEDIFHRVAKNFGTDISEELARGIEDVAKNKFGKNRQAAEIFSLDQIIGEAGLKDSNSKQLEARFRDTFSMIETGKFTMEQGREVLDKNFATFAQHVRESEGLASKTFQEIIALNKTFGTNSKAIKQFVDEQTGVLGVSIANLAAPLSVKNADIKDRVAEAQADVAKVGERGSAEEQAKAAERLNMVLAEQRQFAAGSSGEFERLGVIALGAFNAATNSGADMVTAVANMGPALDTLIGLQKDLGLESQNAGLMELTAFRDRVNANQELVLGTQALGETLKALSSIGGINIETLAAMEAQGVQTFDRLTAAGFTEQQALMMMKGHLLGVIEAHEQMGTPIDENTAKLIEMARKQGLLKDDGKSMTDVMKAGFKDMKDGIDKLVGSLGFVAQGLGQKIPDGVRDAMDALSKIPREVNVGVNVNYNDPGFTPNVNSPDGSQPEFNGPSFATGTDGFVNFGSGTLAMLHGEEAVIPKSRLRSGGGVRGGPLVVQVMLPNGRELAHVIVPEIPDVLGMHGLTR